MVREGLPLWFTLLSILLHWIRTSKELRSPLRLLGMALSCAGFDIAPWQPWLGGTASTPRFCCWREESQQQPKVYHSGPILMTQDLVASNEYPSVTRKVLT